MNAVSGRTVLVVEDEPLIGLDLQELLQDAGYEVVGPATTIEDALKLIHTCELRAALVDLNLGGTLTTPVVEALLEASVPLVLLTGYSSKAELPPFNECPVIRKPYEPRNLLHVLDYAVTHPVFRSHAAHVRPPVAS